jgi:hypothetical protein
MTLGETRAMTEKTIWAVSSGEYSDYGVEAVFATKELAEEYVRIFIENTSRLSYGDDRRVEEFTYYDELPDWKVILVARQTIGASPREYVERTQVSWEGETQIKADLWEHQGYDADRGLAIDIHVEGTDHQRVRKVFSEKLAQAKADPRISG